MRSIARFGSEFEWRMTAFPPYSKYPLPEGKGLYIELAALPKYDAPHHQPEPTNLNPST